MELTMNATDAWVRSGQAAEAARELGWFVLIVLVVIIFIAWRDTK